MTAATAQVDLVLLGHDLALEGMVHDLLQEGQGGGAAHNGGIGSQGQQLLHAAGMVGLGVAHHDVVDGGGVADFLQVLQILVEELGLYGLEHSGLFGALHHVGVVAGTVLAVHHDIEHAQIRVLHADPPDVFFSL